ncbi:MAG: MarC family protein [Bacteroidetes bacterium]|jgi:multiple antibiotic resistance protein|nr:MarC family protein [Bacteroidota bacterium]MBU1578581.1 MarC family protein [Bacteroidota bacterium]MBU2558039.1 MarC family protein [Bacteroidota bacterium]MDA3942375.1 MarC family protein [Bacteroidota bacterium]
MTPYLTLLLLYMTSFITLMNPLGIMPVFLTMTSGLDKKGRRRTAIRSLVTAFFTLIAFAFGGELLFSFFGISVAGLKVVGGVLFFILGYDMLNARLSRIKVTPEEVNAYVKDVSITPLGIPMIAGPGSITNAIILMDQSETPAQKIILIASILIVCLIILVILLSGDQIMKVLGDTGNKILMKLMGLIVMVLAVEFFFTGIEPYLKTIFNL